MVDGFKPGQRKIMFSCFKRNLKKDIKVRGSLPWACASSSLHVIELHKIVISFDDMKAEQSSRIAYLRVVS